MKTTPATVLAQSVLSAIAANKNVKTIARFACVLSANNTLDSWVQMLKVPEFKALAPKLSKIIQSAAEYEAERYAQQLASLQAVGIAPAAPEFLMVDKAGIASVVDHVAILAARAERLATSAEKRAEKHAELVESIRAQVLSELETSQPRTKTDKINKVA